MTEGEPIKQRIVKGSRKPPDEPGIRWSPVRDFWKRNRIKEWVAISTEPAPNPPDEMEGLLKEPPRKVGGITAEQLEKSRKKHFPTFIEEGLPTGDKD